MLRYKRLLIKLSGEAISDTAKGSVFDHQALENITDEILKVKALGVQIGIVIGGGNICRGNVVEKWGIERAEADNIGMLGTMINSLMLKAVIKAQSSHEVRVMTAIRMESFLESYVRFKALNYLDRGYIVIFAGGIGQPYVTTDYPAVQRAIETRCDAILVAKNGVRGVFSTDPAKDKEAKFYETLTYEDFIIKKLSIMDRSAILLAEEHDLPIHIFNFNQTNSMVDICKGINIGTSVSPTTKPDTKTSSQD
jgi:uridylate kinase